MYEFDHSFKWSGSVVPTITSKLQDFVNIKSPGEWDRAILRFKKPLLYNENAIIHFLAELNDNDQSSSPHVECKIDLPVDLIVFRIELRHKTDNKPAVVKRKLINTSLNANYEILRFIPFDKVSKGYEHVEMNPESNFFYRIEWEK